MAGRRAFLAAALARSIVVVTSSSETSSATSALAKDASKAAESNNSTSYSLRGLASAAASSTSTATVSWAGRGLCGLATGLLDESEEGMRTFCDSGLDFWWNWATRPRREYSAPCSREKHVPMVWGRGGLLDFDGAARLMGYNEPDMWGPPNIPGGPTLASGTYAATFHCGSWELAQHWQQVVTTYKQRNPNGLVVSPAMADASGTASAGDYGGCDSAQQVWESHMPSCPGWLKCFKDSLKAKGMMCGSVDCWEIIDVIQFHSYVYTGEDLVGAVQRWEQAWADDLAGRNGAKPKTLWLTEFARAGATDASDPDGQTRRFMDTAVNYLKASPHVSGWSWFSQDVNTFKSFKIGNVDPVDAMWSSELINQQGHITAIGEHYAHLCAA